MSVIGEFVLIFPPGSPSKPSNAAIVGWGQKRLEILCITAAVTLTLNIARLEAESRGYESVFSQ